MKLVNKTELTIIVEAKDFTRVSDTLNENGMCYQIKRADRNDVDIWNFKLGKMSKRKVVELRTQLYPVARSARLIYC